MDESFNNPIVICIIGPTASGKGTQAKLLAESLGMSQVTISHLLSQAYDEDSDQGKRLRKIVDSGAMISAKVIEPFLVRSLNQHRGSGVVVDGFPRTVEQAELLTKYLDSIKRLIVIELRLDEALVYERISKRLSQPGYIPQIDDNREIVEDKMLLYNTSRLLIARAVVNHLGAEQKVNYFQVDGSKSPKEVHQVIDQFISSDLAALTLAGTKTG